jgi:histidine triad (HIT) family protein
MSDTIFDKILRREIKADIVYEDEFALSFRDIHPQAPTHVLVIPKQAMSAYADVQYNNDDKKLAGYMRAISKTANALGLDQGGYRVVFNSGDFAGQEVPYLHAHILSGRRLHWPPG